ncbi:MAG: hypothetical protein BMS9Abin18_0111 [Zetaproteobacteria bacterium]|nr:MAG: hypothetical protein BMS9Abin18_0111 [Zetaproteobacteria bacterium]
MKGTILAVLISFVVMGAAYRFARVRLLHITTMTLVMVFDITFPIYLYLANDWYKRLIEKEQIFSFSIWMHFMLIIVLYTLYVVQIQAGRKLWAGDKDIRQEHKLQGRGIMIARLMVFTTGVLLIIQ